MSTAETEGWLRLEQPDTSNATWIGWWKSDDQNRYDPDHVWDDDRYPRRYGDSYKRLDLINNGYVHGNWWNKPFYRWLENDKLIRSCSSQLGLTRREWGPARGLFHRLPLNKFGTLKEDVAIATCFYVIEKDERDRRRGHPNALDEDQVRDIENRFYLSLKSLRKAYGRVESLLRTNRLSEPKTFDKYGMSDHYSPEGDSPTYERDSWMAGWGGGI